MGCNVFIDLHGALQLRLCDLFVSPCHYSRGKFGLEESMFGMRRMRYLVVRVVCDEGPVTWMRGLGSRVWMCYHRLVRGSYGESM